MEAGSWTDHGATGVSSSDGGTYNAIDAHFGVDDAGAYFLSFGSFFNGLYQVAMSADGTTATGEPYQLAYNSTGEHALEAPYVFQREGYFYLFFSHGQCCGLDTDPPAQGEEYKIYVCRSPAIGEPYVDSNGVDCRTDNGGTLVLSSHGTVFGPGHNGVLDDPTHGTVLYYHYADTDIGLADADYQFGWNVITWSDGWPLV